MSRATAILLATLLLAAASGAAWLWRDRLVPPLPVLDTLGGDFSLLDTAGRRVALRDFRGRVVLLNFGFTSCPDVCPTVLARMRETLRELGPAATAVQPVFVTIDPARDTPERLAPYLAFFDPAFVGLLGTESQVQAVAALFRVYTERTTLPPPLDYGFAHSDQIYLIDRRGRVRATFGNALRAQQMALTIQRLLAERIEPEDSAT
jgi:protein SCO1/2